MADRVGTEDVKKVLHQVYKQQGYIVIGFPKANMRPSLLALHWKTNILFQYTMKTEFEAFEFAKELDWRAQIELMAALRPNWTRIPYNAAGIYFKMRPVK